MKITVKNLQKKIPVNPKRIKKTILNVFSGEGRKGPGEITVSFVTDKKIRGLNSAYCGKNVPTDVLAFDISGPKGGHFVADIIISADTALRNAGIFKTRPACELNLYAIHAALHLLGYDDSTLRQRRLMRKKEKKYANP
ncbi:MAG: rRNA maturation RNase YbeY [Candidatus Omnitrophota bacterium]